MSFNYLQIFASICVILKLLNITSKLRDEKQILSKDIMQKLSTEWPEVHLGEFMVSDSVSSAQASAFIFPRAALKKTHDPTCRIN